MKQGLIQKVLDEYAREHSMTFNNEAKILQDIEDRMIKEIRAQCFSNMTEYILLGDLDFAKYRNRPVKGD